MTMRSLGVDVSEKRGLDLVLLDDALRPRVHGGATLEQLAERLAEWRPDAVAIDSPPAWGVSGGSRRAEKALRLLGIQSYGTPSDPQKRENRFFGWMKSGIAAFAACEQAGYARFRTGQVQGTAIEVFPHATSVVLSGALPPAGARKKEFRTAVLRAHGVELALLATIDLLDAALAALTGLFALRGEFVALGDPDEGTIVVPARELPARPYPRGGPLGTDDQLNLPGLSPCACEASDCREKTSSEFAPGHDAKRKALLWERARAGDEAVAELQRRGWELPPELRGRR
jgi:predicted nuclease with RNAse H fold